MKNLLALILCLLAIAGCEKASNVAAMQDEVTGLTAHYKHRFDELQKRVGLLEQRGRSMVSIGAPQGVNDVRRLFLETNKRLTELKTAAAQAPKSISTAVKSPNARVELIKLMGELHERFEKGEIEVNAQIDQVEQWLTYVEFRPKTVAQVEPPKDVPAPPPAPENPDQKIDGAPTAGPPKATPPKADEPKQDPPKTGSGSAAR